MNKSVKSWLQSIIIAIPIGSHLVLTLLMILSIFTDWVIIIDFNKYGEGIIELFISIFWFILSTWFYVRYKERLFCYDL